jgi:hypothetical protein
MRLLIAAACLAACPALAQQIELPRPSPTAKVSQMVGLTEVSVEYSSPRVNGRKIFGALIPGGKLWRTGANAATKITFSKDVAIGGTKVPAGSYSLFTIPGDEHWTLIVNKVWQQGGTDQYKESEDAVRVVANAEAAPARERLTFLFANTTDTDTRLDLEWEQTRVSLPIHADTDAQVAKTIANIEKNPGRPFLIAARWMLDGKKDYAAALRLADESIKLGEDWFNVWTKAEALAGQGNYREAHKLAERAFELGNKDPKGFFFAEEVKKALVEWKDKG